MLRGLYTAASSMMAQMARQGVISNNLENASTTGYKQDIASQGAFHRLLLAHVQRADGSAAGPAATGTALGGLATTAGALITTTDLAQGALTDTGGELDLALSGPGYFVLQTPTGPQLTRDGSFGRDAEGRLVAADGALVLGVDGPITLPPGPVMVASDGTISVAGEPAGQLRVVEVPAEQATKVGHNRFAPPAGAELAPTPTSEVHQGFLEASNVDLTRSVAEMMAASRTYEASQRLVQIQDDLLGKAVNDVGRVG